MEQAIRQSMKPGAQVLSLEDAINQVDPALLSNVTGIPIQIIPKMLEELKATEAMKKTLSAINLVVTVLHALATLINAVGIRHYLKNYKNWKVHHVSIFHLLIVCFVLNLHYVLFRLQDMLQVLDVQVLNAYYYCHGLVVIAQWIRPLYEMIITFLSIDRILALSKPFYHATIGKGTFGLVNFALFLSAFALGAPIFFSFHLVRDNVSGGLMCMIGNVGEHTARYFWGHRYLFTHGLILGPIQMVAVVIITHLVRKILMQSKKISSQQTENYKYIWSSVKVVVVILMGISLQLPYTIFSRQPAPTPLVNNQWFILSVQERQRVQIDIMLRISNLPEAFYVLVALSDAHFQ